MVASKPLRGPDVGNTRDAEAHANPCGDHDLAHVVTLPWDADDAAWEWCYARFDDAGQHDLYRCRWWVPVDQPMRYHFSFARREDAVEFLMRWL